MFLLNQLSYKAYWKVFKTMILVLMTLSSFGQGKTNLTFSDRLSFDIDIGGALTTNSSINEIFKGGISASAGPKIKILKQAKLGMKPSIGGLWYIKPMEDGVSEKFRILKAGMEFQYDLFHSKETRFTFSPFARIDYNWSSNYFTADETNVFGETTNTTSSSTLLTGKDISYDLGLIFKFNKTYIKASYLIYSPNLKLTDKYVNEMAEQGFIVNNNQYFNFNSLTLSVGINLTNIL
ncbi:hypothetical protein NF867_00720 [Solitalea sp. MAHUQ-68]|uniref:Uncharacterized protein n=1 Tax=Solitalea agri TaxID=2953739 RepID=A0A9X2JAX0_9SPHI|nr:hypothetical protein [Solitalea agri]MCO4291383.1 hypothetical protein [Solitalea agri]